MAESSLYSDVETCLETGEANTAAIASHRDTLSGHTSSIATHAADISTNTAAVATQEGLISSNTESIESHEELISSNTDVGTANSDAIDGLEGQPVIWIAQIHGYGDVENPLRYKLPGGEEYFLDATAAVEGDVLVDDAKLMIFDWSGEYPQLLINIDDSHTVNCALFNNENDHWHEGIYAATDIGNEYDDPFWEEHAELPCEEEECPDTFVIQNRSGNPYVIAPNTGFGIVCIF